MCNKIHSNVLFTAGKLMSLFHKGTANSLPFIASINTEICDIQPVTKISEPEQNTHRNPFFIPCYKTYGNILYKLWNAFIKPLLRILRSQVRAFKKINIFFCAYPFFTNCNACVHSFSPYAFPKNAFHESR